MTVPASGRVLTQRALNRALLARQRPRVFSSRNPFSMGMYLVDGRVVGGWSVRDGRVLLESFEAVPASVRVAIEAEREALERFHA